MVATLETRYNWTYNEIVTPDDMNALGQTATAIRTPDMDIAYLGTNTGVTTTTTFTNITGLTCQLTLEAQTRVRLLVGLRYAAGTVGQRNYFTVQYANSATPSVYTNSFHAVFSGEGSASDDGWVSGIPNATGNLFETFAVVTPELAAGTWIFRPAFRSSTSTLNILVASYMMLLGAA